MKIPYLQYEILEFTYLWHSNIEELTWYPIWSKIVWSAIQALKRKWLLNDNNTLTEEWLRLVEKHFKERWTHSDFEKIKNKCKSQNSLFSNINAKNKSNQINYINYSEPIFSWYKYLEDFPHTFVEDCIKKYKTSKDCFIFDPFWWSWTTLVKSKMMGYKSFWIDINNAMVKIANVKLNWNKDIQELKNIFNKIINHLSNEIKKRWEVEKKIKPSDIYWWLKNMPVKERNQWLSPAKQIEVSLYFKIIDGLKLKDNNPFFEFLWMKAALNCSYVAYCPWTTFYPFRKKKSFWEELMDIFNQIIEDIWNVQELKKDKIESIMRFWSSKDYSTFNDFENKVDLIITSPPYPNDLEYTRQTRLEMYLLNVVNNMEDVQKVKKWMVKWSTKLIYSIDNVDSIIEKNQNIKIISEEIYNKTKWKNWWFDYPKMVRMYFSDMLACLYNYHKLLIKWWIAVLVVWDQTIQWVVVPVAKILWELWTMIWFDFLNIEKHRDRRWTNHNLNIPEENLILKKI